MTLYRSLTNGTSTSQQAQSKHIFKMFFNMFHMVVFILKYNIKTLSRLKDCKDFEELGTKSTIIIIPEPHQSLVECVLSVHHRSLRVAHSFYGAESF